MFLDIECVRFILNLKKLTLTDAFAVNDFHFINELKDVGTKLKRKLKYCNSELFANLAKVYFCAK